MAHHEALINRIRKALAHLPDVKEKKMLRGVTFMVNGNMCLSTCFDEIMCHAMKIKGPAFRGYLYIKEANLEVAEEFDYWIELALDFNSRLISSGKRQTGT